MKPIILIGVLATSPSEPLACYDEDEDADDDFEQSIPAVVSIGENNN